MMASYLQHKNLSTKIFMQNQLRTRWRIITTLGLMTLLVCVDLVNRRASPDGISRGLDARPPLDVPSLNPLLPSPPANSASLDINSQPKASVPFLPSLLEQWVARTTMLAQWMGVSHENAQGDRISINGLVIPGKWSWQEDNILIPDAHLIQDIGLDMLNTDNPQRQPIQWFSDSSAPLPVMQTASDGQFRYLDIAAFAQQQEWRIRPRGDVLTINTPSANVLAIRHGRQSWGDRLVIDLDRPTPFQTVSGDGTASITLDARLPSPLSLPSIDTTNHLRSIQAETREQKTILTLGIANQKRARVWTVPSPPRIIIDIDSGSLPEKHIHWVPGLWWHQVIVPIGTEEFPVIFLEIIPNEASETFLKPIWTNPSSMPGIAPLTTTVQQWQAIAAINGGFFNRNNQLPLGAIRRDGQWYSGPILNRGAIAWNTLSDIQLGRLSLQDIIQLSTGQAFPILHLNSGYVQAGLSRYTSAWGTHYTPLTDFETVIAVENGQVLDQQRIDAAGSQQISIPPNGYLLVARSYQTAANAFLPGTELQTGAIANPPSFDAYAQTMGAGPMLIQQGHIVLNAEAEGFSAAFSQQRAPRSAIAQTSSGSILMVIAPKHIGGAGPTLREMAQILVHLDATAALNLDGGNSSSMYLGGRLLNPSSQTVARVHNGIGIFVRANGVDHR
ncbi:MAG: phosphodiester glycosidase family protein [Cyanobacteria bacterium P01_A01_bin.37]